MDIPAFFETFSLLHDLGECLSLLIFIMDDKSSPANGNGNNNRHHHHSCGGGGWQACFGSNYDAVALYRITLGIMLCIELISRFQYLHPFYSDEG